MSRKKPKSAQLRAKSRDAGSAGRKLSEPSSTSDKPDGSASATREIVESVVIAFVLAFLFRTFEAEAFVIPTGSMAPTLMGRHKDLECEECGFHYQASASDEIDSETGQRKREDVVACTCPMCRHTMEVGPDNLNGQEYWSYKGDRILVSKFPYQFGEPSRWDVAVFKFPGGAKTNYIKRVVGLPNETICISHGDLFVRPSEEQDFVDFADPPDRYNNIPISLDRFTIARKPPSKIRAMLRPVHDNDYLSPKSVAAGWPSRWAALVDGGSAQGWETSDDLSSFRTDGNSDEGARLTYRHYVPSYEDWEYLLAGQMPPTTPQPQLITDFSAYNTDFTDTPGYHYRSSRWNTPEGYSRYGTEPHKLGLHWVGDLAVECVVDVESESGHLVLELVEGGVLFTCRINVDNGKASLSIDGLDDFHPTATTCINRPGTYQLMFANVDDQLMLWVSRDRFWASRQVVSFDVETTYGQLGNTRPRKADLEPVRIGSRGAAVRVSELKVHRDTYYIAERGSTNHPTVISDFDLSFYGHLSRTNVAQGLSDPNSRLWDAFADTRRVAFPLGEGQFLVLGDNSPESRDSRLWEGDAICHCVDRELLIGKALFIYWPHSLDTLPGTEIPFRLSLGRIRIGLFPNFWRMHFVR